MKSRLKFFLFVYIFSCALYSVSQTPPAKPSNNKLADAAINSSKVYKYETAQNDPLKARIYKLDNGLTVYMTVYKDAPRIQTYIAVRAGSKNDPANATGLAHYLEHMLFKGTDKFGTKDYESEKVLIQKIMDLYEVYRQTTNEQERKKIYRQIDSISGIAAKFAIANEYDKLLASIGGQGTNAYTWVDQTVYVNDIPSNQLEKWLTIEAERFRAPVLRLFHTELEAVYEEKNRGLDNDNSKIWESLFEGLFPKHTYGTQTTIGTIEHLKNPSLKEIQKYLDAYYAPNNIAICLSGDLNPDETIKLIDQKFGQWKSKPVPAFHPASEGPVTQPVIKEVIGPDAESITLGFRFAGAGSRDADMITLINKILYNGKAGLIDLNLNQKQKVLEANSMEVVMKDYSAHILGANPKEGQRLEEVKDLLLSQLDEIKKGDFPDWLLSAIINDLRLQKTKEFEQNSSRADAFVSAYIHGLSWQDYVNTIDRLAKITKQEVIDFTKANYNNNYVAVYKRNGEDKNVKKVIKPAITPVEMNRNDQSDFVKEVIAAPAATVEPVFINYSTDIKTANLKNNVPVLYTANKENNLFNLFYIQDMGTNNNKMLHVAIDYLPFLGTSKYTPAQIQEEFYKLGCTYSVFSSEDQIYVGLNGLSENFEPALLLFESLLSDAQPNTEALANLIDDILKKRQDAKLNKNVILHSAMYNYGMYGPKSPFTNILSEEELKAVKPEQLISIIKDLNSYQHRVLYYGPMPLNSLTATLNKYHKAPAQLKPLPPAVKFEHLPASKNVYVVDYDMKQAEIVMLSRGELFNRSTTPVISLFNEYFGGSMSSIVFQELRESKALAYSAYSNYRIPKRKEKPYYVYAYIGSQADKLGEAMAGMTELLNNMPLSEVTFSAAKEAIVQNIRTERITKSDILFNYEKAKKLGLDFDIRKDIYAQVPNMKISDIKAFQEQYLKNRDYIILVLGKKENLDIKTLEKYGKVSFLTLKDIFGY